MASIRKRGSSYLIVVSMGYDYNGKRIKPQQKTVHPPENLTPKQVEKWINEQAVLFERDCRHTPQPGEWFFRVGTDDFSQLCVEISEVLRPQFGELVVTQRREDTLDVLPVAADGGLRQLAGGRCPSATGQCILPA